MPEYRILLSGVAVAIGLIGYYPYFRDVLRKQTKPHLFSWLIWGLLTGVAFSAQIAGGGGIGSWVTGVTALLCFAIAGLALFQGEKEITRTDWICLLGALMGLLVWALTDNPLGAVVVITIVDLIGFIPTFRKSFARPFEETFSTYIASGIKFALGIIALEHYSLTTWLYPASLVVTNIAFAVMILVRRSMLSRHAER